MRVIPESVVSTRSTACTCQNRENSAEARDRFAHPARTWIRLAEELERIQAVLAEDGDETEPKRRAQK